LKIKGWEITLVWSGYCVSAVIEKIDQLVKKLIKEESMKKEVIAMNK
jgi:hypothetical protein